MSFSKILDNVLKIMFLLTTSVLFVVESYFSYQVKMIDVFYKKKCYFRRNNFELLGGVKKMILLTHFLLLMVI